MITTVHEPGTAGDATARALSPSGVSWAAILAGALAAGVLSLLLFTLGTGLGLSSISVWSGKGADGATIGWGAIAWLAVTQLASAAVGGYLAGRLRTKWQGVHTDEVYFRDTAHGFLAWALATIGMVVLAGTVLGSALSGAGKAAATVASGGAQVIGGAAAAVGGTASAAIGAAVSGNAKGEGGDLQYWIGGLLRNGGPSEQQRQQLQDGVQQAARKARSAADDAKEVGVIFAHSLQAGKLSDEDADYVARLVAQHSGMTPEQARQKTQQAFEQVQQQIDKAKQSAQQLQQEAKQAAEDARKATAYSLLWMFVVLLVGAFVGSLSATFGGRQRDKC